MKFALCNRLHFIYNGFFKILIFVVANKAKFATEKKQARVRTTCRPRVPERKPIALAFDAPLLEPCVEAVEAKVELNDT